MKKGVAKAIFVVVLILLLPLMLPATSTGANSQLDVYKLNARGGIPGPNPKPPPDEEPTPPAIEYELFIEIDYIGKHEPTQTVLTYIQEYYYERGIAVAFVDPDNVTLAVIGLHINYEDGINDKEFWAIEGAVNGLGDDNKTAYDDPVFGTDGVYSSKWKWVLYGTTVEGQLDVVGYTWVISSRKDMLAGNYIYIADETADDWAVSAGGWPVGFTEEQKMMGAEAVVLMHEMGHSIGIGKSHPVFGEKYDPDPGSVMSYLSTANAGRYGEWYYSDEYWATRNMEYYLIK